MSALVAFAVTGLTALVLMSSGWVLGVLPRKRRVLEAALKRDCREFHEEFAFRFAPTCVPAVAVLALLPLAASAPRGDGASSGSMLALGLVTLVVASIGAVRVRLLSNPKGYARSVSFPSPMDAMRGTERVFRYVDRRSQVEHLLQVALGLLGVQLLACLLLARGWGSDASASSARAALLSIPPFALVSWIDSARWFSSLHRRSSIEAHYLAEARYHRGLTSAALRWGAPYLLVVGFGAGWAWSRSWGSDGATDVVELLAVTMAFLVPGLLLSLAATWRAHLRANRRARGTQRTHEPVARLEECMLECGTPDTRAPARRVTRWLGRDYVPPEPFDSGWLEFPNGESATKVYSRRMVEKTRYVSELSGDDWERQNALWMRNFIRFRLKYELDELRSRIWSLEELGVPRIGRTNLEMADALREALLVAELRPDHDADAWIRRLARTALVLEHMWHPEITEEMLVDPTMW